MTDDIRKAASQMTLTAADVEAIATLLAGKIGRVGQTSGPVTGETCPVCGHIGAGAATVACPNNNCVRHDDPEVVGLHPKTGEPMKDAGEHAEVMAAHAG